MKEYLAYIRSQMDIADEKYKKAMREGRFDDAYIYGKQAADLSQIYYYHKYHTN